MHLTRMARTCYQNLAKMPQTCTQDNKTVKLRLESDVDATALIKLIDAAYTDMKGRLEAE